MLSSEEAFVCLEGDVVDAVGGWRVGVGSWAEGRGVGGEPLPQFAFRSQELQKQEKIFTKQTHSRMSIRGRHGRISRQVHQAAVQKICNHLWCSEDLQTLAADGLGIRVSPEPGDAAPGMPCCGGDISPVSP